MPASAVPSSSPPRWARRRVSWRALGRTLERFSARFPAAERRASDPVAVVHQWTRTRDREVAALVASSLAFGRASALIAKARSGLEPFGEDLADACATLGPGEVPPHLRGWVHRWVDGPDLAWLLGAAGRLVRAHGSVGEAFRAGVDPGQADLLPAMTAFARRLHGGSRPASRGAGYLVPVPDGHAAAKRLCLFLRWMVRPADGVDLGEWPELGPARLTVPLDTHVARIGAYLGLTDRRTPGWAMAREITANLARFDPADPTRFDFALSHLGIMGGCPRRRDPRRCASCDLVPACRL